jgi:hypothetical protein
VPRVRVAEGEGLIRSAQGCAPKPAALPLSLPGIRGATTRCFASSANCPRSNGGRGGIRTPGTLRFSGFQDRRDRPLCHPSSRLHERRSEPAVNPLAGSVIFPAFERPRALGTRELRNLVEMVVSQEQPRREAAVSSLVSSAVRSLPRAPSALETEHMAWHFPRSRSSLAESIPSRC